MTSRTEARTDLVALLTKNLNKTREQGELLTTSDVLLALTAAELSLVQTVRRYPNQGAEVPTR